MATHKNGDHPEAEKKETQHAGHEAPEAAKPKQLTCGLIMPISPVKELPASHWEEVKRIVEESVTSITEPKFKVRLVSDADAVSMILDRIVNNLYEDDIVVCDVSTHNPNVMFELGMRLAFDKHFIIIKDDATTAPFDTASIEYIEYRRDLRYDSIVSFKKKLSDKVQSTYGESVAGKEKSPFLRHFGKYQVAKLHPIDVSSTEAMLGLMRGLQGEVQSIRRRLDSQGSSESDSSLPTRWSPASRGRVLVKAASLVESYVRSKNLDISNPNFNLQDLPGLAYYVITNLANDCSMEEAHNAFQIALNIISEPKREKPS